MILTRQITFIPTPTSWTGALSEHFPHILTIPASPQPREPPPNDSPKMPNLCGGIRTPRSPQPARQSTPPTRHMSTTMPWTVRTTPADLYGSTFRQHAPGDYHQESMYHQQTPLKTSRKLNRDSTDTSTQNVYRCLIPIQSNKWNGQSSEKNGKYIWFSSPPPSRCSPRYHWWK